MVSRIVFIVVLILAGEMIFSLPFHTARFFRPTLLEVFGYSNTQLGDLFAIYGITAMLSYFPGGILADRFSARGLLTTSLMTTAVGGLYMATFPPAWGMGLLYGYWGITTILLFWGALLRATRDWGGSRAQGRAFGILDGGRGLAAAVFGLVGVFVLSVFLPEDAMQGDAVQRREGFRAVIYFYSAATFGTGLLTWTLIPGSPTAQPRGAQLWSGMKRVLARPTSWAHAAIIVCGYCGYKGLDNLSLYAVQVLGMDEVEGARFAAYATYARPVGAIAAGFAADRFVASKTIGWLFVTLVGSCVMLALGSPETFGANLIIANLLLSSLAVYAIRGVYFALLEETRTPTALTGTTVGMVSFVGFTPEIFFAPIAGRILDNTPGIVGHQHYFLFLGVCMALGVMAVISLVLLNRRPHPADGSGQR